MVKYLLTFEDFSFSVKKKVFVSISFTILYCPVVCHDTSAPFSFDKNRYLNLENKNNEVLTSNTLKGCWFYAHLINEK